MPSDEIHSESLAPGSTVAVAGASVRAAAGSLRRAGLLPICADLFCDRDLVSLAHRSAACPPGTFPSSLPEVLTSLGAMKITPLILTGAMENHLDVARGLDEQFTLITSSPDSMDAVRDPLISRKIRSIRGIEWPETRLGPMEFFGPGNDRWLIKPRRSAAGMGVRLATKNVTVDDRHVVQRLVNGAPISAVFVVPMIGTDRIPILFGATSQLSGDESFGAREYRYVGNAGPLPDAVIFHPLRELARELVTQFRLRGVFNIDAILGTDGVIYPIEINPRYSASIEVLEMGRGTSIFSVMRGQPMPSTTSIQQFAKAVVYALRDGAVQDLYEIFSHEEVADVPVAGSRVKRGHPICTLFSRGENFDFCLAKLRAMAQDVYTRGVE